MKTQAFVFFILFQIGFFAFANDSADCLSYAGKKKCGYGCVQSHGEIYCGEKPGMSCLTYAGKTKCGFDCKQYSGKIECGSQEGDTCMTHAGKIKCGQACRVDFGEIKCGVDENAHGRDSD